MAEELDPPRKYYQLKPREFEAVNDVPSASLSPGGTPGPPTPHKIEMRDLYQQALTPGPVLKPGRRPVAKNDVHAILDANLAQANAAGLNDVPLTPKRRSRRTRDFFIIVIPLDALFAYAAFGPYSNVMLLAYGLAGLIISTIGLGWVMFFVMDDY
jgi:hypothetical protein